MSDQTKRDQSGVSGGGATVPKLEQDVFPCCGIFTILKFCDDVSHSESALPDWIFGAGEGGRRI